MTTRFASARKATEGGVKVQVRAVILAILPLLFNLQVARAESTAAPERVLTVCEVFQDLLSYSGKMLRVRGRLIPYHEGWMLTAGAEERCASHFVVGDTTWPSVLSLEDAGSSLVSPPAKFDLDREAMGRLVNTIRSLQRTPRIDPSEDIRVIVTGELRTRELVKEMLGSIPIRYHYGPGYGPAFPPNNAQCPAQLVIKTVQDIVVKPK